MESTDDRRRRDVPPPSSDDARRRMRVVRRRDTDIERRLRSALHREGLRYRIDRQVLPGMRRRVDIVFGPSRVAVLVHGCYWHGCDMHGTWPKANAAWWRQKIEANRRRDADTRRRLTEAGWTVIEIWEHDSLADAVQRILSVVHTNRHGPLPASPMHS